MVIMVMVMRDDGMGVVMVVIMMTMILRMTFSVALSKHAEATPQATVVTH